MHLILYRNNRNYLANRSYGYLFRQLKNFRQAITCYKDALELRPQSPDCWLGLATSYRKNSQYDEAIDAAEKALKYSFPHTKLAWTFYELGFCNWKMFNVDQGEEYLLEAIKHNPGEYWFHKNLSELYYEKGDKSLGEIHFNISESLSMDNMRKKDMNAMFDASDGV